MKKELSVRVCMHVVVMSLPWLKTSRGQEHEAQRRRTCGARREREHRKGNCNSADLIHTFSIDYFYYFTLVAEPVLCCFWRRPRCLLARTLLPLAQRLAPLLCGISGHQRLWLHKPVSISQDLVLVIEPNTLLEDLARERARFVPLLLPLQSSINTFSPWPCRFSALALRRGLTYLVLAALLTGAAPQWRTQRLPQDGGQRMPMIPSTHTL